jgi:polyphosphate glucokinase
MSAAPFGAGTTFDQMLGNAARKRIGNEAWTARVVAALEALRPVLWWDRCVVGGGNVKHLTAPLPPDVEVVPNLAGLLGGVRLWTDQSERPAAPNQGQARRTRMEHPDGVPAGS